MVVQTHSHQVAPSSGVGTQVTPASSFATVTLTPLANTLNCSRPPRTTANSTPPDTLATPACSHSNISTATAAEPLVTITKRSVKAVHREQLCVRQKALDSKLLSARQRFEKEVDGLGKEYRKSSSEIRGWALLRNKYGIGKRKVNSYNTFRHKQSKACKASKESLEFTAAQELDTTCYQDADAETIATAKSELEEEKKEQSGYVYKTLKGQTQHTDKVIRGIDQVIKELNLSCGVESICIFVSGSNRDHSLLQAAYTSKGIEFFEGPLKKNLNNVLQDFQTFAQGGTEVS
ncbi:hypothetical protein BN14_09636 [Rhizoctonia solani AG-1 IB]|uniref:Uncharacterized protein n=1 Tax=Thanatephorus cucumeris (strain AG1-IB / isolate 7/3/14) TaxID=1108050 RepID=M5C6D6_THACB|nr:hypothetical protein BN14_09636 [Rhizoctonia solani AG-1 IB]